MQIIKDCNIDNWSLTKLGELCEICYGKDQKKVEAKGGDYPIYGTGGFMGNANSYLYDMPSVLIGRKGTIDRPQFVNHPFWTVDTLYYTKINSRTDVKWLYYALSYYPLKSLNEATGVPSLNRTVLNNIRLCVPPYYEQQKISQILSTVDEQIQQTQAIIDQTQQLKKGLMQKLFSEGIGHKKFKESKIGRVPDEWEVQKLFTYLDLITYGFTNPMPETDNGIFMLTAKDVNGKIDYDNCRKTSEDAYKTLLTNKSKPQLNDILLTKDGTLGRVGIVTKVPCCINQSVALLRPNKKVIPKFLKYLLEYSYYQNKMLVEAGGSTIKHIYITIVDKMKIAMPKISEQYKIIEILMDIDNSIDNENSHLKELNKLKKGLMQDLLTGKKRVII